MRDKNCKFEFKLVEIDEVENLLCTISVDNCAGTDCLDGKLLRTAAIHISTTVCHLFNACLSSGICPKLWKEGQILPIIKNPKFPLEGQNSRPITILSILSKLLEKIVFKQIQDYFTINNLMDNAQHGYRGGHSTCTALVKMTDDLLMGIDKSLLSGAILLDFTSAFDLIDHKLLIDKLRCYGFGSMAVSWFESYSGNRTQRVYLNGTLSNSKSLSCGVPQGSCLGPLLFSIFTNDLPLVTHKSILVLYADDTTLYYSASTIGELHSVLSKDMNAVSDWVISNRLVLIILKTKSVVFGP